MALHGHVKSFKLVSWTVLKFQIYRNEVESQRCSFLKPKNTNVCSAKILNFC